MDVVAVSRADAAFGYGSHGEIYEIADALPDRFWQHPHRAWSPLIRSTIPGLENVFLKYEGSHLSGSFKDRIMAASLAEMLAKSPDCPGVVVPSSGNAAVSAVPRPGGIRCPGLHPRAAGCGAGARCRVVSVRRSKGRAVGDGH